LAVSNEALGSNVVIIIQTVMFMAPALGAFFMLGREKQKIIALEERVSKSDTFIESLKGAYAQDRQKLEETIKDVNGVGKKVSEIRDSQLTSMTELKAQMDHMANTLAKVTTSIDYIQKDIDAVKKKIDA